MRFLFTCFFTMAIVPVAQAQPFFFTGAVDNEFFTEANWNSAADGTGSAPGVDTINPGNNAITGIDLIIDGDDVVANGGRLDFSSGSLTIQAGSSLTTDDTIDVDPGASLFSVDGATVATASGLFLGGQVLSISNSIFMIGTDVELQNTNSTIVSSSFTAGDDFTFVAASPVLVDTTIISNDLLGLQNDSQPVVQGASVINLTSGSGAGDIESTFSFGPGNDESTDNVLIAMGTTTIAVDSLDEGRDLALGDFASAVFESSAFSAISGGSRVILNSLNASVTFPLQMNEDTDLSGSVVNGLTGLSYEDAPNDWNITDWDGVSPVTLQVTRIPEPTSLGLLTLACRLLTFRGTKKRIA